MDRGRACKPKGSSRAFEKQGTRWGTRRCKSTSRRVQSAPPSSARQSKRSGVWGGAGAGQCAPRMPQRTQGRAGRAVESGAGGRTTGRRRARAERRETSRGRGAHFPRMCAPAACSIGALAGSPRLQVGGRRCTSTSGEGGGDARCCTAAAGARTPPTPLVAPTRPPPRTLPPGPTCPRGWTPLTLSPWTPMPR